MNSKRTINWKLFLVPLFTMLFGMVMSGCSDDKDELQGSQYGYVQFKIYKSASYVQEEENQSSTTTRATTLSKLGDVQKVEIEMQYNGKSITQTLVLNAYNESNAEYGMRSDKLQLLVGDYKIIGYKLLDKLDKVVISISASDNETFSVISQGLTIKDLTADVQARGSVTFKLIKDGLTTRASLDDEKEYLFSNIAIIDVTVTNTFTRVPTTIKGLKVKYKEESIEHQNPDNADDKYMDIGTAKCDSAVWLPVGTYQVTEYITYSKKGAIVSTLGAATNVKGDEFTIIDNEFTEGAIVPIKLSETAEYIKDYLALKEIWENLDGKNWGYHGIGSPEGTNWNFNKELDMWGDQPGVSLDDEGRVTGLSIEGFGAKGKVPDAIGQLTELRVLALGSHSETAGGRLFTNENMQESQKQKVRMNYKEMFLDYDPRIEMSELLQSSVNRNPKMKAVKKDNRIHLKDTQIGNYTNQITHISKAVMRLTKLQQFYMGNSPFLAENICTDWADENSEYAKLYKDEAANWSWKNMTELTDIELYNCSKLTTLPEFLYKIPEMQVLNIACSKGIEGTQLTEDWERLADPTQSESAKKIQILYMSYNNLEVFPENEYLKNMEKLGLLDCMSNKITTLHPFGSDIKLTQLNLNYNKIKEIPEKFCGFTDQVETLSFAHNELEYIPNIFNANSVYVMGSVDFSYNNIGINDGKNIKDPDSYTGINASTVTLSFNKISKFPTELFKANSPITTITLNNNLMEKIPQYSLTSKEGNGKEFKNTYLLGTIDLRFNKLTELSDDFRATTLPYLTNMDVSFNRFSEFPTQPLNSSVLQAFGIRHQRNAAGERCLRDWPTGITKCPSLLQLQIGSNDIRKVNEEMTPKLWILDIKDNPNISIDLTSICPYIEAGMYMLIYDKTQDIRGCDALDIKR
ncbi:DUF4458 domain-containing protein [Bacteroides clarus]|jgi:Leucine-rich repeat (LRR) protein|uniref:DUF4458 domain-containing protein n=1 Tax=Bacteroides clarus TaxID=626929 RepID=A0A1Y3YX11_9BACE|nr:DUF4458 domain-containing protein [Bacteroides clarus]MBD9146054.1 DUF4458 domain-containing protein [Bacteroides clarus]OUO02373.1 hypothetical protein B5F97_02285 [Bacteroides clarus]